MADIVSDDVLRKLAPPLICTCFCVVLCCFVQRPCSHSCHKDSSLSLLFDACFCCLFTEYRTHLHDRNIPSTYCQDFSSLCRICNISFPRSLICHAWMQQLKFIRLNNLSDAFSPLLAQRPSAARRAVVWSYFPLFSLCLCALHLSE